MVRISPSARWCLLSLVFLFPLAGCGDAEPPPPSTGLDPAPQQANETSEQKPLEEAASSEQKLELRKLSEDLLKEGWISLFDGQTLFGWEATSEADWSVEDGAIVVSAGEKGLLCTKSQFDRYVLRLDFRSDPRTNSGVFLNTPRQPTDPARDCYELNIAPPDNPFPTGSLVQRQRVEGDIELESGEWQTYEVRVEGGHVQVSLNDRPILDYEDPSPLGRGHIGLQLNSGRVEFRNILIKPLGVDSIFNGRDLTGWKEYPEMASDFSVTEEGYLHVRDGRGQLETEATYGDFVLQLECITHAPNLNSGIFFRCIPGDVMMGYESQIHNGYKDGDRTQPVDYGTGGIFRRQPARLVAADDQEWFHKTIVVHGPHVAVWVNGFPVCEWTDDRSRDENPRKGLRLEPGTIMIQGHDPTTDISFRNLRAKELLPRGE